MTLDFIAMAEELGIRGRRAGNQFYARCPLHRDRTPSFSLNVNTGYWTCHYGCGPENGRTFVKLVELINSVSFMEAKDWMRIHTSAPTLEMLHEKIERFFSEPVQADLVLPGPMPEWMNEYDSLDNNVIPIPFLQRGFSWDTINAFGIRWNPETERVVIPVYVEQEMVGTVSRTMRQGVEPKYVNSPGLQRDQILFGLQPDWTDGGTIIIVEGVLDAVWLQQLGHRAVCMFGSSIGEGQIDLLHFRRYNEIILAMDNPDIDKAAKEGIPKVVKKLIDNGFKLHQIRMPKYPNDAKDFQDIREPSLVTDIINNASTNIKLLMG